MDVNELRKRILRFAYEARIDPSLDRGYLFGMDFDDRTMVAALSTDKHTIENELSYLYDKGLLELKNAVITPGYAVYFGRITAAGIDYIEGPGPFNSAALIAEIQTAGFDEPVKTELESLVNDMQTLLDQFKDLAIRAEKMNEDYKGNPKVRNLADFAGRLVSSITKGMLEP